MRRLHGGGAHVVIADLNAEKGEALAGELGERATFAEVNVTDADAVQAAVDGPRRTARPARRGRLRRHRLGAARHGQAGPAPARPLPATSSRST